MRENNLQILLSSDSEDIQYMRDCNRDYSCLLPFDIAFHWNSKKHTISYATYILHFSMNTKKHSYTFLVYISNFRVLSVIGIDGFLV